MSNLQTLKRELTKEFQEAALDTPELDVRLLMMSVLGLTHSDMIAASQDIISATKLAQIRSLADRRLAREPVDKILGKREFYGRSFKVTKDVLSPRPDTEVLIDAVLELYDDTPRNIIDLGLGSGAILLTLLSERPSWNGLGVDISQAALEVAKDNAKSLELKSRAKFIRGSWFTRLNAQKFDLVISNPPYIDKAHMDALSPEVAGHDPALALYGGEDGLDAYRIIVAKSKSYLKDGAALILEIGYDQGASVSELLRTAGFTHIELRQDLAGHDRVIIAR